SKVINSVIDTGTPALRSFKKNLTSIPAIEEKQLLEQVPVLLVLEQRSIERWNQLLRIVAAQRLRRKVLGHQKLDPIEELRGGSFFLEARRLAYLEECGERFAQQLALQVREMHVDDLCHRRFVREADVMKEAAPQERVGQLLLVVARDHDHGPVLGLDGLARFVGIEF